MLRKVQKRMSFFKRKKPEKVWTTKTGEQIPLSKLTDTHLHNIYNQLCHKARAMRGRAIMTGYDALACLNGEMAIYSVECGLAALEDPSYDDSDFYYASHPLAKDIENELLRRG